MAWCHWNVNLLLSLQFMNTFTAAFLWTYSNGPLARYVNLRAAHAPGMPGTFSPPSRFCNPDMHRGTWARTCRDACLNRWLAVSVEVGGEENVPGAILCIWWETHKWVRKRVYIYQKVNMWRDICYDDPWHEWLGATIHNCTTRSWC